MSSGFPHSRVSEHALGTMAPLMAWLLFGILLEPIALAQQELVISAVCTPAAADGQQRCEVPGTENPWRWPTGAKLSSNTTLSSTSNGTATISLQGQKGSLITTGKDFYVRSLAAACGRALHYFWNPEAPAAASH